MGGGSNFDANPYRNWLNGPRKSTLGFFVFGIIAGSIFDNGSKGAGLFVGLIVNPLVGAVLFSTMIQNFINKKRFKVYQDFEAAVNDALRNIEREV